MRQGIALLLCLAAGHAAAQSAPGEPAQAPVKCADAQGRITYSNVPCEKQGLKQAGTVADRTTVVRTAPKAAPKADKGKEAEEARPGPGIKPVNPLTEKLAR